MVLNSVIFLTEILIPTASKSEGQVIKAVETLLVNNASK
jgi:hypothetical protein